MTHPLNDERKEKFWNNFIESIKTRVIDKDESLKSIPNNWGENPMSLIDIINKSDFNNIIKYTIDSRYTIKESIKDDILKIFNETSI
jgi:hypothetical protein